MYMSILYLYSVILYSIWTLLEKKDWTDFDCYILVFRKSITHTCALRILII